MVPGFYEITMGFVRKYDTQKNLAKKCKRSDTTTQEDIWCVLGVLVSVIVSR
jgi:hypothetical protein